MERNDVDFGSWRKIFRDREARPLPSLEADLDYTRLPPSLARSLARFQLGESGGGTLIRQARDSRLPGVDADYVGALELFVAEEHRHANLLAVCVRLIGGRLLRSSWTASAFVCIRRLLGLRFKILVLLAAEVVGLSFYRLIATRLPPCRMRDMLLEMVGDEHSHLRFHCAFLREQVRSRAGRILFLIAWRVLMTGTALVAVLDHRRMLREMHVDMRTLYEYLSHYRLAAEVDVLGYSDSTRRRGNRPRSTGGRPDRVSAAAATSSSEPT